MDHLGWRRFHVVGHSMGGMIACKLAAAAPQRLQSLSILSATGGGWQAVPKSWSALWLGIKVCAAVQHAALLNGVCWGNAGACLVCLPCCLLQSNLNLRLHSEISALPATMPLCRRLPPPPPPALQMLLARTPEARAAVDVQFHFSASLLREQDSETGETRQQQLVQEYVEAAAASAAPQPAHGMRGQLAAVVRHRVRRRDVRAMQSGAFPILVSCELAAWAGGAPSACLLPGCSSHCSLTLASWE
jgi:pimeloyl-ACP methyl ester carboxylesterase